MSETQWISTSEKMPPAGARVLVAFQPQGGVTFLPTVATWTGGKWININWHRDVEHGGISHWMPLPDHPALLAPSPREAETPGEANKG